MKRLLAFLLTVSLLVLCMLGSASAQVFSKTALHVSSKAASHVFSKAALQSFTNMTVDVPSGWTAAESDNGDILTLRNNSDSSQYIRFAIGSTSGRTLQAIAESLCSTNNGSNLEQNSSSGFYSFTFTNTSGNKSMAFVDDSTTDSRVPSGYYWVQFVSTNTDSTLWNNVLSSLVITVSSTPNTPTPSPDTTTTLTTQSFTNMTVGVPSGWTASESDNGDILTLRNNSDSSQYIRFAIGSINGRTLQAIAESLCSTNNGSNLEQNSTSGFYSFTFTNASGNKSIAFVDDSTTDSRVPSGYYWVQFVSINTDSTLWKNVLSSLVITAGGGGSQTTAQEEETKNRVSQELLMNPQGRVVINSDSGGGCSTGMGTLSLLVLALALVQRKHR